MTAQTTHLRDRLRLGEGTGRDDLPFLERTLAQLSTQLNRFHPSQVEVTVRIRDRGRPSMVTTLEVDVHGLPTMIGTSTLTDTKDAVNEAEARVVAQLQRAADRRIEHR